MGRSLEAQLQRLNEMMERAQTDEERAIIKNMRKAKLRTFADLKEGDFFIFRGEATHGVRGPWVKLSRKYYAHINRPTSKLLAIATEQRARVQKIDAEEARLGTFSPEE